MSKLFCISPGLRVLERQMQQPPGYRTRGYGICIIEEVDWKSRGNYSEIVDCVISRMQLEHLKKRVEEIFSEADSEIIFRLLFLCLCRVLPCDTTLKVLKQKLSCCLKLISYHAKT